jgi:tetratricopeptide (TPR) repeat protein
MADMACFRFRYVTLLLSAALMSTPAVPAADAPVRLWEESLAIPTYAAGAPELNPIFYFGKASQGAEGRVYPYPLYDTLTHRKENRTYRIVYLENEYIRVGVLPEIGGRIFEGVDKTNGYDFFYRQHVIKPALIGLIGAWISGGVEWNIPHHHRASTFIPVQYRTGEESDGGKTIWVGELEPRHRMRWAVGYTLRPGRSYLEARLRILNRTPLVQTMLCFANVAVHANENYQVVFPPGTQYGTHHSKREFIEWPISNGRYGGAEFKGVDVSWYKNHISSNSIFAWNYEDDFVAGYDHGKQAGTMSVSDHNIVPGKKLWTWGNGPRGRMWDKILTDEDGPYIEIMVGAYSDNQPDYSWLQPYEAKSFSMYWYPYREIGAVKRANLEAAVNLEVKGGAALVGFSTTAAHNAARVSLKAGANVLLDETISINPGRSFTRQIPLPAGIGEHALVASISAQGRELVSYQPARLEKKPMPSPVTPPAAPKDIGTVEELYLTGLRIEQFHHPTLDPEPYWEEALQRDAGDTRVNTAFAVNYIKKARFAEAEKMLRKAIERLTDRYTTPKDAEAIYYLGLALKAQGKIDEAYSNFYKSTWSLAWRAAGYQNVAEIAASRGDFEAAARFAELSLQGNALNIRAMTLRAAALRHLGRADEARPVLERAAAIADPLDARILAEIWLLSRSEADAAAMAETMNRFPATAAETAAEYMGAGLWDDGAAVLQQAASRASTATAVSPMVYYYLGYFSQQMNQTAKAADYYKRAQEASPDYCFPFQHEMIDVFRGAMKVDPRDGRAPYLLGNLLYDWQPEVAIRHWEQAAALEDDNAILYRNLALAYSRRGGEDSLTRAILQLEKAVSLDRKYPIHFSEVDDLYAAAGFAPDKRLALLEKNWESVTNRDDALSRAISLKIFAGKYDEAIRLLGSRTFAVWEGGTLNVADSWTDAHILRGKKLMAEGRNKEALADFQAAGRTPDNLPSESRSGNRAAEAAYWSGVAHSAMGNAAQARRDWETAAALPEESGSRARGAGAADYYRGLAMARLGKQQQARQVFQRMIDSAAPSLQQTPIDFFASFGEQQSRRLRRAAAHYQSGLGYLGLDDSEKARQQFREALQASPDHIWARAALEELTR